MLSVIYEPFCDTLVPFFIIQDNFDILAAFWDPSGLLTELRTLLTLWVWPIPDLFPSSPDLDETVHDMRHLFWLAWEASWLFWKLLLHSWDSLEDTSASSPSWRCTLACLELILTTLRNLQTYWLRFLIHLRLFPQYTAFPSSLLLCWVGIFEVTAGTFETPLWL